MIPTLTNNDSITSQKLRRHSDPPWLWTIVCIASVSLHLLVFWLMRSSSDFPAWLPCKEKVDKLIELINIEKVTNPL